MNHQVASEILAKVRAKAAQTAAPADMPVMPDYESAVRQLRANQLNASGWHDVRNLALASLAGGAAARGLFGLVNTLRRGTAKKRDTSQMAALTLPYPVKMSQAPAVPDSTAGLSWYMPAMFGAGLGGLGLGWKGLDMILEHRREAERQSELDKARRGFRKAVLTQYDKPLPGAALKLSEDVRAALEKLSGDLDVLYDRFTTAAETVKKADSWTELKGRFMGGYGAYAGLAGLVAGAIVYDKMRKRSRRAIIDAALAKRRNLAFSRTPTEIYATPESVAHLPTMSRRTELEKIKQPPSDITAEPDLAVA
jgi:hypothetical protein